MYAEDFKVTFNFGQIPFEFNINLYIENLSQKISIE